MYPHDNEAIVCLKLAMQYQEKAIVCQEEGRYKESTLARDEVAFHANLAIKHIGR